MNIITLILLLTLYFAPTINCFLRGVTTRKTIFVFLVNLFGFTGIFWLMALIMSYTKHLKPVKKEVKETE